MDVNGVSRECVKIALDSKFLGYVKVDFESKNRKGFVYSEWYPKADFIKNNPNLAKLVKVSSKQPKDDLGRVSLASLTTLTDKSKKWKRDEFVGSPLWISRGRGEGQTRTIVSNSEDTLIIDKAWKSVPNNTSQYVISYNVHDPQVLGNILPPLSKPKKLKKLRKLRVKN